MANHSVAAQLAAIRKQKLALEKKEMALRNRGQRRTLRQIIRLARAAGLSAAEISAALGGRKAAATANGRGRTSKLAGRKLPPKYRNPSNSKETWAGRGRAPAWALVLEKSGKLDSALIKP